MVCTLCPSSIRMFGKIGIACRLRRHKFVFIPVLVVTLFVMTLFYHVYFTTSESWVLRFNFPIAKYTTDGNCFAQVHVWINSMSDVQLLLSKAGEFSRPGLPCGVRIVYGKDFKMMKSSDVLFFFYKSEWDWDKMIRHRPEGQKWVLWMSESPRHTDHRVFPPSEFNYNPYNYFMTYRTGLSDSSVIIDGTYGRYLPGKDPLDDDWSNWAENKTGLVAWVVSNCYKHILSWKRSEFVEALSRHVPVQTFGHCGQLKCSNLETCGLQHYKFYLALENSECREYITEKFWYNSLTLGLVPIVYGPPKEDYLKVAPPNSFIHVQDFESVSELARYLLVLDQDESQYNRYFEWRGLGMVSYNLQFSQFQPENLCRNVVNKVLRDEQKDVLMMDGAVRGYPDVPDWKTWWIDSCHSLGDFPININ